MEVGQENVHPLEQLGNWKVVMGIVVIIVIILVLSFSLDVVKNHMYPSSSLTQGQVAEDSIPTTVVTSGVSIAQMKKSDAAPDLTQQHLSNNFSIKYPSGWTESQTESLGSIIVTFTSNEVGSSSPQMVLSSLDLTQASYTLASGADLYRDYGYNETSITIDHLAADKLAGVFPPPVLKLKNAGPTEWATNIYITKGTNDYMIRYIYLGGKEDPMHEKLFSDMLSTLQLR